MFLPVKPTPDIIQKYLAKNKKILRPQKVSMGQLEHPIAMNIHAPISIQTAGSFHWQGFNSLAGFAYNGSEDDFVFRFHTKSFHILNTQLQNGATGLYTNSNPISQVSINLVVHGFDMYEYSKNFDNSSHLGSFRNYVPFELVLGTTGFGPLNQLHFKFCVLMSFNQGINTTEYDIMSREVTT